MISRSKGDELSEGQAAERSLPPSQTSPSIVPSSRDQLNAAPDRGRQARTPSEIPARGWKDILLRVYANVSRHRIMALAAGMTYYSILAIFPAIAALVAVYGLFADASTVQGTSTSSADFCRAEPLTSRASS